MTLRMSYARSLSFFEGESRGKDRPSEGLSGKRWNSCTRVGEERAMSGLRLWVLALGSAMAIAGCASVPTAEETVTEDYDPWESFNTAMFSFNRKVDRYALKPVAKAWDKIV